MNNEDDSVLKDFDRYFNFVAIVIYITDVKTLASAGS